MEQSTLREQNRTGIYVQESVGATTAGDGLAPQGDKSPVTTIIRNNALDEKNTAERDLIYTLKQCKFRKARNQEMKEKLLEIGFVRPEIRLMQAALEKARKDRYHQNRLNRICKEKQLEPEKVQETWIERKERELVKYKAEKAAKIAAGIFNPLSFRERKQQKKNSSKEATIQQEIPLRTSDERHERQQVRSPGVRELVKDFQLEYTNFNRPSNELFISPGILAGQTEDDNPDSFRNKKLLRNQRPPRRREREYEILHRRMNLGERHMICISPSDLKFGIPKMKEFHTFHANKKLAFQKKVRALENALNAKYPKKLRIIDSSNIYGRISKESSDNLLDAIIATINEERALGAHYIKIGPYDFRQRVLKLRCKNDETTQFLESQLPYYNSLCPDANLLIDYNDSDEKFIRRKIKVDIQTHNLTSCEFLKIIKKQNGYPTEFWEVYYKNEQLQTFWAIIAVDPRSYKRLVEAEGMVYFFFDRIYLDLNPKKIKKSMPSYLRD